MTPEELSDIRKSWPKYCHTIHSLVDEVERLQAAALPNHGACVRLEDGTWLHRSVHPLEFPKKAKMGSCDESEPIHLQADPDFLDVILGSSPQRDDVIEI